MNCSKYVNSRHEMFSLINRDMKHYILRSLTLVILELLPQTLDSFRVGHIFFFYISNLFVKFCRNAPPHGDLEKC